MQHEDLRDGHSPQVEPTVALTRARKCHYRVLAGCADCQGLARRTSRPHEARRSSAAALGLAHRSHRRGNRYVVQHPQDMRCSTVRLADRSLLVTTGADMQANHTAAGAGQAFELGAVHVADIGCRYALALCYTVWSATLHNSEFVIDSCVCAVMVAAKRVLLQVVRGTAAGHSELEVQHMTALPERGTAATDWAEHEMAVEIGKRVLVGNIEKGLMESDNTVAGELVAGMVGHTY